MSKKKKNNSPKKEKNAGKRNGLLFVYPDFKQASTPLTALINYRNDMEKVRDGVETSSYWNDEDRMDTLLKKIKKILKMKKNTLKKLGDKIEVTQIEAQIEYLQNVVKKWNKKMYFQFVQDMYNRALCILNRYLIAYDDILCRQSLVSGKQPKLIYVIKYLAEPVAKRTNVKVGYEDRLKTWHSTVQKLITRMETCDPFEMENFFDIFGAQFVLMGADEKQAEKNCYNLANNLFYVLKDLPNQKEKIGVNVEKVEFLVPRYVGPVDNQIEEEYIPFVKDYINNPKKTGYSALHICVKTTIISHHGERIVFYFEIQITTRRKKEQANNQKKHDLYKKESKIEIGWDLTKIKFDDEFDFSDPDDYIDEIGFIDPILLTKPKKFVPLN